MAVDYDDIAFSLEYQYDSPEETKDYIKVELAKLECLEPGGTFTSDEIGEQSGANGFPANPLQVILGAVEDDRLSHALQDFENAARSLKAETEKREEALQDRHAELTRYKAKLIKREKALDMRLEAQNKLTKDLADKEHSAKQNEIDANARIKEMDAKDRKLDDRERELNSLEHSLNQRIKAFEESSSQRDNEFEKNQEEIKVRESNLDREIREAATTAKDSEELSSMRERNKILNDIVKQREEFIEKKETEKKELAEKLIAKERELQAKADELAASKKENTQKDAEIRNLTKEHAVCKNPYLLRLDSGLSLENSFTKLHDENPNAGMFVEKAQKLVTGTGPLKSFKFLSYRTLQFPAIKVDGKLVKVSVLRTPLLCVLVKPGHCLRDTDFSAGRL